MGRCFFVFVAVLAALLFGCASNAIVMHIVCGGYLPLQERDVNNNVLVTYTRGLDLSGSLQGAGGIGGLLARQSTISGQLATVFYHQDVGGNVTALMDAYENIVGKYTYSPFGKLVGMWGASMARRKEHG